MRDSEQMYPVVFTAAIIQRNLRLSETYNTNVRFFTIIGNCHVVILRDADIQNHTANACPETVYTVLLDIAG